MIPEPGDANHEITETFHLQTDDELFYKELKQIEADYQAIQTILLGLPEDIYAAVDSYETTQEIWLRVQQMMKGSDIGIQEKKDKLFNEWERFTSNEGESIESYYHLFLKLMNDLKSNKHFPEKIASNLKFLNNLQPEWSRHVTIVHQTKDLHTTDYTQLYDFLKYNQKEVDELKAERIAKNHDPLALMANSNYPYESGFSECCSESKGSEYGSAEIHENCDDNEIFNMFTQEDQYTELLEPIPESHQVPENDVISEDSSVEQGGETVEQHPANFEETRALYDSLYQNLTIEVEKVNSVKSTIVTLQRVVKQRMTNETHNWSSFAQQELHKIVRDENFPIVNQVDARLQNFEMQFLKEAGKFVGDFKSLANEADASLAKHKAL
nr:hypothetical protein [Tanacetum cinerariifolium]